MKNRIALAFALALVPAAACAETWVVVEGADGKRQNVEVQAPVRALGATGSMQPGGMHGGMKH